MTITDTWRRFRRHPLLAPFAEPLKACLAAGKKKRRDDLEPFTRIFERKRKTGMPVPDAFLEGISHLLDSSHSKIGTIAMGGIGGFFIGMLATPAGIVPSILGGIFMAGTLACASPFIVAGTLGMGFFCREVFISGGAKFKEGVKEAREYIANPAVTLKKREYLRHLAEQTAKRTNRLSKMPKRKILTKEEICGGLNDMPAERRKEVFLELEEKFEKDFDRARQKIAAEKRAAGQPAQKPKARGWKK